MTLGSPRADDPCRSLAGEKVLVTGGSGFLGSHLCRRLREHGAEVHAVSRSRRPSTSDGVRWWQGDLADIADVRALFREVRPDVVFHLSGLATASPDREKVLPTLHSLLVSTVNVLMITAEIHCRRLVLAASLTEPEPGGSKMIVPSSPYAAAKWAGSAYARMFHQLYDTPVVMVRPFMTYGPGQEERKLIPHVILSLLKGQAPKLSSGRQRIDWIYVDDVMDGFIAAAETPGVEGRTIDLGSGVLVPMRLVVRQLVEVMGARIEPLFHALPDRPYEPVRVANIEEAYATIGWKPQTPLHEGLRRSIQWYSRQPHGGLWQSRNESCVDTYLGNVEQNDSRKIYPAKAQRRKVKNIFRIL